MIKNRSYLEEFEKQLVIDQKSDFSENLKIYESMWLEAVALGVFPLKDPYDGLRDDIRIACILNRIPEPKYTPELLQ